MMLGKAPYRKLGIFGNASMRHFSVFMPGNKGEKLARQHGRERTKASEKGSNV